MLEFLLMLASQKLENSTIAVSFGLGEYKETYNSIMKGDWC